MMALNDLTNPSAGPLAWIPYFIHSLSTVRREDFITPKLKKKKKKKNSFRNCKKWCTKAQSTNISLLFSSYVNWQAIEYPLDIGEGARRDVACGGLVGSQAVAIWMNTTQYDFVIWESLIFSDSDAFAVFLFKSSPRNRKTKFITPPPTTTTPAATVRWFTNHIRRLRVKVVLEWVYEKGYSLGMWPVTGWHMLMMLIWWKRTWML